MRAVTEGSERWRVNCKDVTVLLGANPPLMGLQLPTDPFSVGILRWARYVVGGHEKGSHFNSLDIAGVGLRGR